MERFVELKNKEDFDKIKNQDVAIIFKHSTRCPASAAAHHEMEQFLAKHPGLPIYLVDVIEWRNASDHIADATGIQHESPQAIILKEGTVAWHGSHSSITLDALENNVSQHKTKEK